MRVVPPELAVRVKALFPVDPENEQDKNLLILDQLNRGGLALPELIRMRARPEIDPTEILATIKAIDAYANTHGFLLKIELAAKAKALATGEPWGFDDELEEAALLLADEIEAALTAQGLNDHPIALPAAA